MKKQVLFIQGGGDDGFKADAELVESLGVTLGNEFEITYPELQSDETAADFGWPEQIGEAIDAVKDDVILVGHSLGASLILKYLSELKMPKNIVGIFLLATPFWSGDEDWVKGLMLKDDFASQLPHNIPISMYHCMDDDEVPFEHLSLYAQKMQHASFHKIKKGGHQFNNDLKFLAKDIAKL